MRDLEAEGIAVASACDVLGIDRSGYYKYRRRSLSSRRKNDISMSRLIEEIFWEHRRRYGSRRIAKEMTDRGYPCGPVRVARLMKQRGLVAIQPKSFRPKTTHSRHTLGYSPNLLLDAPPPSDINQVWVADITYIPLLRRKFAFLALLMDLFSRRIVGWHVDDQMTEPLVLTALRHATATRQPPPRLIHHSDRGGQYAAGQYRAILARGSMRQSMSRPDNCYDNAFIESCFGTLKTELEMLAYDNLRAARREVDEYIAYYNVRRRHSALDYATPRQFEQIHQQRQTPASDH